MFKFVMPKFIFKVEKWKWNKECRLYVSTMGHFRDEHKQPIPIKLNQNGYVVIRTRNGYQMAHRLVMKTWMPTEDMDNLTVDHLDHNKRNNVLDNLEWVTEKENKRRAQQDHLPSAMKKAKKEMLEAMKQDVEVTFKEYVDRGDFHLMAATSADEETTEKWVKEIQAAHPHVIFENCASGGLRMSLSSLEGFDSFWISDNHSLCVVWTQIPSIYSSSINTVFFFN